MASCTQSGPQPFPIRNTLAKNMNTDLESLRLKVDENGVVYFYVIATLENNNGKFEQTGCGPNIQGGFISLCTCKHPMRSLFEPEDWVGKWVAGFSGVGAGHGRNGLFYLMKVKYAYASQYEFWNATEIPLATKEAKSAQKYRYGDLFEPQGAEIKNKYSWEGYQPPCEDHVHSKVEDWVKDIAYQGRSGKRPALLVGDPEASFIWDHPMYFLDASIGRGHRKSGGAELLDRLRL